MTIKLGIAPINWSNDDDPSLGGEITFEQCISEMSSAGYIGTELGNKYPRDPIHLKQTLADKGLQMSSAWFSTFFTESEQYDATLSRFLTHLSFMRAAGAKFINVCECGHAIQQTGHAILGMKKPQFNSQQWQQLIQGLHTLGRIAHDFGVHVVYHYHAGTGVFTEEEIDFLMQNTSPQLLGLLLDTGHAAFAGINVMDLINKYKRRIRYVHLKDIRLTVLDSVRMQNSNFMDAVREGVFTVPGDGDLNFIPLIQALKEVNYQGWMIVEAEQDPAKAPPLAYAQKAFAYLEKIL
ncbi:myo-inosose-2 dehydratase [Legionella cardiaca]|uniref:Myo-inosose-2 dehydratase n=1 Tax=Legionella cardiaca TaxID=1071983 RepID=A0ABY8AQD3_9GAMM|nr:myo-inosose-2 dehydratase [Legionella cardiaca]WED42855.1 myo-inosose-2 dehydratase [Legionella cardiaca]